MKDKPFTVTVSQVFLLCVVFLTDLSSVQFAELKGFHMKKPFELIQSINFVLSVCGSAAFTCDLCGLRFLI